MAFNVVLGSTAKVAINWRPVQSPNNFVPFRVIAGSILDEAELEETTDTDTQFGGREYLSNGYCVAQIQLSIQIDLQLPYPSTWLYAVPYALVPGYIVGLKVWPEGYAGPVNSNWIFTYAIVKSVGTGFSCRETRPYGGQVTLSSYGRYKRPYETLSTMVIPQLPPSAIYDLADFIENGLSSPGGTSGDPFLE